jgi:hypothetical protein
MSSTEILDSEYPGEEAWSRFSDCYSFADKELCEKIDIDQDIAQVLLVMLGSVEYVNSWLSKSLPALDGDCVSDVLKRSNGGRVIRSLVMRMP